MVDGLIVLAHARACVGIIIPRRSKVLPVQMGRYLILRPTQGLPVRVYRLSTVSGDSVTGWFNPADFTALIISCTRG